MNPTAIEETLRMLHFSDDFAGDAPVALDVLNEAMAAYVKACGDAAVLREALVERLPRIVRDIEEHVRDDLRYYIRSNAQDVREFRTGKSPTPDLTPAQQEMRQADAEAAAKRLRAYRAVRSWLFGNIR